MTATNLRLILVCSGLVALILFPIPFVVASFEGLHTERMISHVFGVISLMCMALTTVLSARPPLTDALFKGLDKSYVVHKWLGLAAFLTLLLHDTLESEVKGIPDPFGFHDLASSMGEWVYNGLLFLIAVTFLRLVPYRWWRITHRFMIAMFVLSVAHFFLIPKPLALTGIGGTYLLVWSALGILCGLYALRPSSFPTPVEAQITALERKGKVTSLTLKPKGKTLRFKAGQFVFVRREGEGLLDSHPFTINTAPNDQGTLQLAISAYAGWTHELHNHGKVGDTLLINGPHGRFLRKPSARRQVWISGGIGITPFLAWAAEGKAPKGAIDIIHICRNRADIVQLDVLEAYAAKFADQVSLKIVETSQIGRPTARDLLRLVRDTAETVDVWFCGSAGLRASLNEAAALSSRVKLRIHQEEFRLRTDLPTPNWLKSGWHTVLTGLRLQGFVDNLSKRFS